MEKKQLFKIVVDANGTEVSRTPLTKGRPPRDSHKDSDGNLICPMVDKAAVATEKSMYIDLDENGNETGRVKKGRGRPKTGYTKRDDGHWVKIAVATVATEAPTVEAPADIVEV